MKTKRILCVALAGLALAGMALAAGCSGGSGQATPGITSGVVTRANEGNYSLDALVMAARESANAWINADVAARRDADLSTIRQRYPALGDIRPRAGGDMRQMLISIPSDAPWFDAWKAETLTTGVPAVDSLLTEFKAARVRKVADFSRYTTFLLTFDGPLQIERLAARFKAASDFVKVAEINGLVGYGDDVVHSSPDGVQQYVFSKGWGDCTAGCVNRHYWTVRIAGGGSLSLEESGMPLPAPPAP